MDKNKLMPAKIILIVVIVLLVGVLSYDLIFNKLTPIYIPDCPPTATDIDGNTYNTVIIGSQCWMKENLKATKNPEGKDIARYCYDNDPKICETDGGLYNWNTTMNGSTEEGAQGICPTGWHVPTDLEWYTLESGLATDNCSNSYDYRCNPAGARLRKGGGSGFEGIFAGYYFNYKYEYRGWLSFYWTSTGPEWKEEIKSVAIYRLLNINTTHPTVARHTIDKNGVSLSLRCLKD